MCHTTSHTYSQNIDNYINAHHLIINYVNTNINDSPLIALNSLFNE